jgi:hypothetical protein
MTTAVISLAMLIMHKFNWYSKPVTSQVLKIQLDSEVDFEHLFDPVFIKYTLDSELISIDSVR